MGIGLILICLNYALAANWYDGREIDSVSLIVEQGQLQSGELLELLQTKIGGKVTEDHVGRDIRTLYAVGSFDSIEVEVSPIVESENVQVVFWIVPAPIIDSVEFEGFPFGVSSKIRSRMGSIKGTAFYEDVDGPRLFTNIKQALIDIGWTDVELDFEHIQTGQSIDLRFVFKSGTANRFSSIDILGFNFTDRMYWALWLSRKGLVPFSMVSDNRMSALRVEMRDTLISQGYNQARVNFIVEKQVDGTLSLSVLAETGPKIDYIIQGQIPLSEKLLTSELGIFPGERILSDDSSRFQDSLKNFFLSRGYLEPKIAVSVEEGSKLTSVIINSAPGPLHRYKEAVFVGSSFFAENELKSTFRDDDPILVKRLLVMDRIERGIKRIRAAYIANGFFDVQLSTRTIQKTTNSNAVLWTLEILIEEGERTQLSDVRVLGGVPNLVNGLSKPEIGPYSEANIKGYLSDIKRSHQNAGFLHCDVRHQLIIDDQENRVAVDVFIEPYQIVLLRTLSIEGAIRTKPALIMRQLPLELGRPITIGGLEKSRNNLYDLDVYQSVAINTIGEEAQYRDVLISVIEKPNIALKSGLRVATDQGFLATFSGAHRNLLGWGHRLELVGQFGYAWSDEWFRLDTTDPIWRFALNTAFRQIPINGLETYSELLFGEANQQTDFRTLTSGISTGLRTHGNNKLQGVAQYSVRRIQMDEINPGVLLSSEQWQSLLSSGVDSRYWSGVNLSMVFDQRNNPIYPDSGTLLTSEISLGDGFINQIPTVKLSLSSESHWSINWFRSRIGLAGGIARTSTGAPVPLEERFFAGGPSSVRGFIRNSIGPANQVAQPNILFPSATNSVIDDRIISQSSQYWVVTGGDVFLRASGEVGLALDADRSSALVFFGDIGHLSFVDAAPQTSSEAQQVDPFFRYAIGTGLRYQSPIGPISIDLGWNISPMVERDEQAFVTNFSMGSF